MPNRVSILLLVGLLAVLLCGNLLVLLDLTDIRSREALPAAGAGAAAPADDRPLVRVGVVSRFAPNVIYAGYQPIIDYLSSRGTHRYELRLSTSYQDAVDRLRNRSVDVSFLGAWIYGRQAPDPQLVPIVAPLNSDGVSAFKVVLVTGPESPVASLAHLAGARVALPSPQSWSGNWLQTTALATAGLRVADLDSLHHFDHHQTVVWRVLRGEFDAGVVKESVAAEFASEGLRPVISSAPFPGPPLVGHRDLPRPVLLEIRRLLLALDPDDPGDLAVLASWTPEFRYGFTEVAGQQYEQAFRQTEGGR